MEQKTKRLEEPTAFQLGDKIREEISSMEEQNFRLSSISIGVDHQTYVYYADLVFTKM